MSTPQTSEGSGGSGGLDRPSPSSYLVAARIHNDSRFAVFEFVQNENKYSLKRSLVSELTSAQREVLSPFPVLTVETPPADEHSTYFDRQCASALSRRLRSVTIINSVNAGTRSGSDLYVKVLGPLLQEFGVSHVYVAADSAGSIAAHATSFSASATVVVLGGDTSLHEFVNALPLAGTPAPELRICLIPVGSGNAIASSLGHMEPLAAVQRLFLKEEFAAFSTFSVKFPPGSFMKMRGEAIQPSLTSAPLVRTTLVVASWGFHSALVADSEEPDLRDLGIERFQIAARRNAEREQLYKGTLAAGPQQLGPRHSYLLITGMTNLEPKFRISPRSEPPSSNRLDVIWMPVLPGSEIMDVMMKVYDHSKHLESKYVTYEPLPAEDVVVTVEDQTERDRRWCIDGAIIVAAPGDVRIGPATHEARGWRLKIMV